MRKLKDKEYKEAIKELMDLFIKSQMLHFQRCLLDGCRYGVTDIEDIKDTCIYCGQARHKEIFLSKSLIDELTNYQELENFAKNKLIPVDGL